MAFFAIDLGFLLLFLLKTSRSHKKKFFSEGVNKSAIKILLQKGLTNPSLTKVADKSVRKRRGPKTGTTGEVRPPNTSPKWGQNFFRKGLTNPSLKSYSERA